MSASSSSSSPLTADAFHNTLATYITSTSDPSPRPWSAHQSLIHLMRHEENKLRRLFATSPSHPAISSHPNIFLLSAYSSSAPSFAIREQSAEELSVPRVFPLSPGARRVAGVSAIVDRATFERNVDVFTEGQLKYLNWDNVLMGGGCALAALQFGDASVSNAERRAFFHTGAYYNADVDLFLYGLDEAQAREKVVEIYDAVCEAVPGPVLAVRTKNTVTLVSQFPRKHIQIVLRCYVSPAEVLMGFDCDSCSLGYNGRDVLMTARAHNALVSQYNEIDLSRRSPSYEIRLCKYSERGFEVLVPSLDRRRIDPQIYERRFSEVQGLARLLLLERFRDPKQRQFFKIQQRLKNLRPQTDDRSFWSLLNSEFQPGRLGSVLKLTKRTKRRSKRGPKSPPRAAEGSFFDDHPLPLGGMLKPTQSDYAMVFLPWGPTWTTEKICELLFRKDMMLNSKWYAPNKRVHTHPCFFGTAREVLGDCCGSCPPWPEELDRKPAGQDGSDPDDLPFVHGELSFIVENAGRQMIGSFHPITDGDWREGAVLADGSGDIMSAAFDANLDSVEDLLTELDKSAPADTVFTGEASAGASSAPTAASQVRDSIGRTMLHVAAYNGNAELAQLALKHGVDVKAKMGNGRTALHVAAAMGSVGVIRAILEHLAGASKILQQQPEDPPEWDVVDKPLTSSQATALVMSGNDASKVALQASRDRALVDLDATDPDLHMSALHFAAAFGHHEICSLLIRHGARASKMVQFHEPTHRSLSSVYLAAIHPDEAIAERTVAVLLREGDASVAQLDTWLASTLHRLVQCRRANLVRLALELQRDECLTVLGALGWMHALSTYMTPLDVAAWNGDLDTCRLLLDAGAKPNADLDSVLVLEELLKHRPAAGLPMPMWTERYRSSTIHAPLFFAISGRFSSYEVLDLLLDRGADPYMALPSADGDADGEPVSQALVSGRRAYTPSSRRSRAFEIVVASLRGFDLRLRRRWRSLTGELRLEQKRAHDRMFKEIAGERAEEEGTSVQDRAEWITSVDDVTPSSPTTLDESPHYPADFDDTMLHLLGSNMYRGIGRQSGDWTRAQQLSAMPDHAASSSALYEDSQPKFQEHPSNIRLANRLELPEKSLIMSHRNSLAKMGLRLLPYSDDYEPFHQYLMRGPAAVLALLTSVLLLGVLFVNERWGEFLSSPTSWPSGATPQAMFWHLARPGFLGLLFGLLYIPELLIYLRNIVASGPSARKLFFPVLVIGRLALHVRTLLYLSSVLSMTQSQFQELCDGTPVYTFGWSTNPSPICGRAYVTFDIVFLTLAWALRDMDSLLIILNGDAWLADAPSKYKPHPLWIIKCQYVLWRVSRVIASIVGFVVRPFVQVPRFLWGTARTVISTSWSRLWTWLRRTCGWRRLGPKTFDRYLLLDSTLPLESDGGREAYRKVYRAVWAGDSQRLRALVDTDNVHAVRASSRMQLGATVLTPLLIAALRGHVDTVDTIIDLAQAQYSRFLEREAARKAREAAAASDNKDTLPMPPVINNADLVAGEFIQPGQYVHAASGAALNPRPSALTQGVDVNADDMLARARAAVKKRRARAEASSAEEDREEEADAEEEESESSGLVESSDSPTSLLRLVSYIPVRLMLRLEAVGPRTHDFFCAIATGPYNMLTLNVNAASACVMLNRAEVLEALFVAAGRVSEEAVELNEELMLVAPVPNFSHAAVFWAGALGHVASLDVLVRHVGLLVRHMSDPVLVEEADKPRSGKEEADEDDEDDEAKLDEVPASKQYRGLRGSATRSSWAEGFVPWNAQQQQQQRGVFRDITCTHAASLYGRLGVLDWVASRAAFDGALEFAALKEDVLGPHATKKLSARQMAAAVVHHAAGLFKADRLGRSALHFAVLAGRVDSLWRIHGLFDAYTRLLREHDYVPPIVRRVVDHASDDDGPRVTVGAFDQSARLELVQDDELISLREFISLPTHAFGWTPLHLAVIMGRIECMRALLQMPELDVMQQDVLRGWSAFTYAVHFGHYELISAFADELPAAAMERVLHQRSARAGVNALHVAAMKKDGACLKLLLSLSGDDRETPLARLDELDAMGNSVVQHAVASGNRKMIEQVRTAILGADPDVEMPTLFASENFQGRTAVDAARDMFLTHVTQTARCLSDCDSEVLEFLGYVTECAGATQRQVASAEELKRGAFAAAELPEDLLSQMTHTELLETLEGESTTLSRPHMQAGLPQQQRYDYGYGYQRPTEFPSLSVPEDRRSAARVQE